MGGSKRESKDTRAGSRPKTEAFDPIDPKLRQKRAAAYLGVGERTFREYNIPPKTLPGRGARPIRVWPVSILDKFLDDSSDPRNRKQLRKGGEA